ncbi:unnamed protein product, partial [Allacma fusca]
MFLASAGRVYCIWDRGSPCYGVMPAFRSALVWLYQLPVKPKDMNAYFAEFLENRARDATEMSKLRAEMCYKTTELTELKKRNQALDDQMKALRQRTGLNKNPSQIVGQNEQQFEIMQRFFQDLQEFHPSLLSRASILLKEDEQPFGGESEGGVRKLKDKIEKKDYYQEFVNEMKKFDPWGIVFPYIRKGNKKAGKGEKPEIGDLPTNTEDSLAKQQNRKPDEETSDSLKTDDDDSRSVAELLHSIYTANEAYPTDPTPHQEEPITWDTEYWKQFFKEGDILPEFGISITDPKASMFGKVIDANTDIEVQYFNPNRFTSDDISMSLSDIKQLLEFHAKNMRLAAEPPEIRDTPATRNYRLDNVWTSPKFAYGSLPFKAMRPGRPSATTQRSRSRLSIVKPKVDASELDDVIKTDVSYGDPLLSCAKHLRAYSNASKSAHKSSTAPSRRYSSSSRPCSRERETDKPTSGSSGLPIASSKVLTSVNKTTTVASKLPSNVVINRPKPSSHKYPGGLSIGCEKKKSSKSPIQQRPLSDMKDRRAAGDCCEKLDRVISVPTKPQTQSEKDLSASSKKSLPLLNIPNKTPASDESQLFFGPTNTEFPGSEFTKSRVKKPRESAYHFQKSPIPRALSDDDSTLVSDYDNFRDRDRLDPCDPKEVVYIHPYPELLAE